MGKDKSAKKRARDEEAGEGAGAGPAKRVQVEVVHPAKDEAPALVSYLPFGMPPEGAEWSLHEHGMGRVKNYSVLGRKVRCCRLHSLAQISEHIHASAVSLLQRAAGAQHLGWERSTCGHAAGRATRPGH